MSISTHVLDAVHGQPAAGIVLRLERLGGTVAGHGTTDTDGRCPELTQGMSPQRGRYRLRFETDDWFAHTQTPTFYPVVEVVFEIADPEAPHHVPPLLSPFAHSTYRGS